MSYGSQSEQRAAEWLTQQGWRIQAKNYHSRYGEIDIIATDPDGLLRFIEVKARRSAVFGDAAETITPAKQRKIVKTAWVYMDEQQHQGDYSFDAILIRDQEIQLIEAIIELREEDIQ